MPLSKRWAEMSADERRAYAEQSLAKRASDRLKYPLSVMAAAVGTTTDDLKRAVDPTYAGASGRNKRRKVAPDDADGTDPLEASRAEYDARRREVPDDTRAPGAALLGDPIPGDTRRQRYGNEYSARGGDVHSNFFLCMGGLTGIRLAFG